MTARLIGVDVGGTKIAVATLEGATLSTPVLAATDTSSAEALIAQLVAAVGAAGEAVAVGVAVPSVVDWETGSIRSSVNIPLQNVPLRHLLTDRLGCPCSWTTTPTRRRSARPTTRICGWSRPRSSCSLSGRVSAAASSSAGGSTAGSPVPRPSSGTRSSAPTCLRGRPPTPRLPSTGLAGDPARRGARWTGWARTAASTVARSRRRRPKRRCRRPGGAAHPRRAPGVGVANAINTFDPEEVVIGGGVSSAGDLFLEPHRDRRPRLRDAGRRDKTRIRLARWGPQAGVRGAALLAGQELG